jgi:ferredoxin
MSRFIHKNKLPDYLKKLSRDFTCLVPDRDDTAVLSFTEWQGETLFFEGNTDIPLKEFVYPRLQKILDFEKVDGHTKITPYRQPPLKPTVVFGLRPCDTSALSHLTQFGEAKPKDQELIQKRENIKVVTVACEKTCDRGFCTSLKTGPIASDGFDLQLIPCQDGYIIETENEYLFSGESDIFEDIEVDVAEIKKGIIKAVASEQSAYDIGMVQKIINRGDYSENFQKEFARRCQQCTGCVFVCPTCTCFDIVDVVNGDKGERLRVWDACFLDGFTGMAQGSNPLKGMDNHLDRRLRCKLSDQKQANRILGCVGCGRCDIVCPGNIGMGSMLDFAGAK